MSKPTVGTIANVPVKIDTRVLEYVARAPMMYPVAFELLPEKWPAKAKT